MNLILSRHQSYFVSLIAHRKGTWVINFEERCSILWWCGFTGLKEYITFDKYIKKALLAHKLCPSQVNCKCFMDIQMPSICTSICKSEIVWQGLIQGNKSKSMLHLPPQTLPSTTTVWKCTLCTKFMDFYVKVSHRQSRVLAEMLQRLKLFNDF